MNKTDFFLFLFFCAISSFGFSEKSSLVVQARAGQNSVKAGMMFLVDVSIFNQGDGATSFWVNNCSYEKHWVTDHAGVFIQSWTCNENDVEEVTLESGDTYQKNIILYIPKPEQPEPVTFSLGFKRMSENNDVAEPIWSDPITMRVIVPGNPDQNGKPRGDVFSGDQQDREDDNAAKNAAEEKMPS